MATLHGQANSISDRIYQSIMSATPNRRPRNLRPASASTQLSFPSSPRHSARSKVSQTSKQGAYSDYDVIKNRSWSASRVKSGHFGKAGSKRVNAPVQQPSGLSALTDSRPPLSPASAPGTARGDSKGKQLGTRDLWNLRGSQVDRLHQEWAAVEQCRAMKRASEMVQHRLDPMYRISGSNIPLLARYHVNDHELQRLREMTETSRILQLDLKRIKYPQGCHSPRREKTQLSKSHVKLDPGSAQPGESREGDKGREGRGQIDVLTSPLSQPLPAVGDPHPTSPVSTPEDTPRFPGAEGQEDGTEQGEVSYTDNSHHVS